MHIKDSSDVAKPVPRRSTIAVEELYPRASVLADIVDLARKNTDLPPLAALFGAYSQLTTAMAQAGFTLQVGAELAVAPNLQLAVLVDDDANPGYLMRALVHRVMSTPPLCELPATMTSASLFAHAKANAISIKMPPAVPLGVITANSTEYPRCVSLLRLVEGEGLLKALHSEQNLGKLRRQLETCCNGQPLHQYTKKEGDEWTAPVHLSMFVACRQTAFFRELAGRYFTSTLVQQLLVVLSDDRPMERKPLYSADGITAAMQKWNRVWQGILAGPRNFVPTSEAEAEYSAWWMRRLTANRDDENQIRGVGLTSWKYALAIQALIEPKGSIGIEAVRIALAIADRHLADQTYAGKHLASETTDDELARKVVKYIHANPEAPRGKIMTGVRGASDPATLNRVLVRIAEIHEATWISKRALELRAAARTIGTSDAPRPRS